MRRRLTTASQAALLAAAFARDRGAEGAASVEAIHALDPSARDLLPVVAYRRHDIAGATALERRFDEAAEHWGRVNPRRLGTALDLARRLNAADVPVVLADGLAVSLGAPETPALRPLRDTVLYIKPTHAQRALNRLAASGCARLSLSPRRFSPEVLSVLSEVWMRTPDGHRLRLTWRWLPEICRTEADADVWRTALPLVRPEGQFLLPAPGLMLLRALTRAGVMARGKAVLPLLDAALILEACGEGMDWSAFGALYEASRAGLVAERAIDALATAFDIPDPALTLAPVRPTDHEAAVLSVPRPAGWALQRTGLGIFAERGEFPGSRPFPMLRYIIARKGGGDVARALAWGAKTVVKSLR